MHKGTAWVEFKKAVRICMRQKYATFRGRADRTEFWYFTSFLWAGILFWAVIGGILAFIVNVIMAKTANIPTNDNPYAIYCMIPLLLFILYTIIPSIAVSWRRFHDLNLPGWIYVILAVSQGMPAVGIVFSILYFILMCLHGTEGKNKYGLPPA